MSENKTLEELRAQYTALYGKEPSPKSSENYLLKKIAEKAQENVPENQEAKAAEEVISGTEEITVEATDLSKAPEVNVITQESEKQAEAASSDFFVLDGQQYPHRQGNLFAVIFKGQLRYFTQESIAVIQKDPTLYANFSLPPGSPVVLTTQKKRVA